MNLTTDEAGLCVISVVDDPEEFGKFKKDGGPDFLAGVPYMIKKYDAFATLSEDRPVKTSTSLFRIQYAGQSGLPGHKGFGQTSYMGDAKGKPQELLVDMVPEVMDACDLEPYQQNHDWHQ